MGELIEAIKRRISIRAYADRPVEDGLKKEIRALLGAHRSGPFGNRVRMALVDLSDMEQAETRQLGTYGFITGARLYLAAAVREGPGAMPDAGYCMEQAIVGITRLGLGTCWLGGTFKRASFARRMDMADGEVIPAISPVGYAHDRRTARERVMRRFVGADQRKPWEELFFEGSLGRPLRGEAAGRYSVALECLRLAPSASNNQPWRIVKAKEAAAFHFFLKRTRGYARLLKAADLQLVDMGIAMAHFEMAARESGLDGAWSVEGPGLNTPGPATDGAQGPGLSSPGPGPAGAGVEYVISWIGK